MKTSLLCFLVLLVAFGGCDKIKEAATIKVSTQFTPSFSVIPSAGLKSFNLVAVGPSTFTKTETLVLADNVDLAPHLERVKSIDINTVTVSIPNLGAGQTIGNIKLEVEGVGMIFEKSNITSTANNPFTPELLSGKLDEVAAKLTTDRRISLTVSGNSTGITSFTVNLTIGADVFVSVIN